jgi:hypothetical protein
MRNARMNAKTIAAMIVKGNKEAGIEVWYCSAQTFSVEKASINSGHDPHDPPETSAKRQEISPAFKRCTKSTIASAASPLDSRTRTTM